MNRLRLYALFHLNLSFSSIAEESRPDVVRRCYWPLLRLAETAPLGLEASGHTLECIHAIDPAWTARFKELAEAGQVELIGSGYVQMIGPLAPPAVNRANLAEGNRVYEALTGRRPAIALVNEQAYAPGLVSLYREAGFDAIVTDWANPYRHHPEWKREWRSSPQWAEGNDASRIRLLWSDSVPFQRFQRYAHGEMELDEVLELVLAQHGTLPLYGNDAEIFDFRPGRFATEPGMAQGEWQRIQALFAALQARPEVEVLLPSRALAHGGDQVLRLESPESPIPVKKQPKYNITRWAISGRDDLAINTLCWRCAEALERAGNTNSADWRELCWLWSSDFRTHITASRWQAFRRRLDEFAARVGARPPDPLPAPPAATMAPSIQRKGRLLELETAAASARLNLRRGLAVDRFGRPGEDWLFGTLPMGFFDDIAFGADFYSGHMVLEQPGQAKIADLEAVEPVLSVEGGDITISGTIAGKDWRVDKQIRLFGGAPRLDLSIRPHVTLPVRSQLRLGWVTLNPDAFDRASLFYECHNGGTLPDRHSLAGEVDMGAPASLLVSAQGGLGLTGGTIVIGDARRRLRITCPRGLSATLGLVKALSVRPSYLCRVAFSAREIDETCVAWENPPQLGEFLISVEVEG